MQIAAEVRRVLSKNPGSIKIEHFRLKFGEKSAPTPKMTVEEAAAISKARWLGMFPEGKAPRIVPPDEPITATPNREPNPGLIDPRFD